MGVQELSHTTLLPSLRNKTALTVFYASWCPHCKRYLQSGALEAIQRKIQEHGDAGRIAVYRFEASTIPEHASLANTLFKDPEGKPLPITGYPTFVLTYNSPRSNSLRFQILDPSVGRDPESQYRALMDFDKHVRSAEQK